MNNNTRQSKNMIQNTMDAVKTAWKYFCDLPQPWKKVIVFLLSTCATVIFESLGSGICLGVVVLILLIVILMANKQKIPAFILGVRNMLVMFLLVACMLVYELFVSVAFTNSKYLQSSSVQAECTIEVVVVLL